MMKSGRTLGLMNLHKMVFLFGLEMTVLKLVSKHCCCMIVAVKRRIEF